MINNSRVITEYTYTSETTKQVRSATPQQRSTQNSMINDQSLMSSRSSEIFNQNQQDLRMKRGSLAITIFLMSVEIERLKNENEKLRFRVKEMDDKKFTIQNYEQQINDLKERLIEMEGSIQEYSFERQELITKTTYLEQQVQQQQHIQIHQHQALVQDLRDEIENLRIRLRDFESQKVNEIQIVREQLEYEMKMQLEKGLQEHDLNVQYQREFIEGELKKWKELTHQKQRENDELKHILEQRDISKQRELENQLQSFRNENERIKKALIEKQEDLENWKEKCLNFSQMNDDYQRLDKENQSLQETIYQLQNIEEQNQSLLIELEKLRQNLRVRSSELEDNKTKILRLEKGNGEMMNQKKQYEEKIVIMQQEIDRQEFIVRQKNSELEQLQKKHVEFERLVNNISNERNKLQDIEQKLRESEKKNGELEIRYKNLLLEVDKLNKNNKEREMQIYQYTTKIEEYESQTITYTQEIDDQSSQIEQLKQRIIQLLNTIEQLKKYEENIRILSAEIDRQNITINQQEDELKQWRLQYANEGSLIKKLQEQLCQMIVLIAEVESLRARLFDKEQEVDDIRRSSLAPFKMS